MIIAFTGRKGSGKSLACSILKDKGYEELNFADPLKQMAVELATEIPLEHCYILEEKERPRDIQISAKALDAQAVKYGYAGLPTSLQGQEVFSFISLRNYLQWLGTEFGRSLDLQFWIKVFKSKVDPTKNYVCGDLRFENEAATVTSLGGSTVMINRPSTNTVKDTHASEQFDFTTDYSLLNNDLETFKSDIVNVEALIRKYGKIQR